MRRETNAIRAEMYELEAHEKQEREARTSRKRGVQSAWLANDLPDRAKAARRFKAGQEITLIDGSKARVVSHDTMRGLLKVRIGSRSFTCNPKTVI